MTTPAFLPLRAGLYPCLKSTDVSSQKCTSSAKTLLKHVSSQAIQNSIVTRCSCMSSFCSIRSTSSPRVLHQTAFASWKCAQVNDTSIRASMQVEGSSHTKVLFIPDNIVVTTTPGAPLSHVAREAGVDIVESCGVGDCGTCEVMLVDEKTGDRMYIKSCVTKVPEGDKVLVIDTVGDSVPPW